MQIEMASSGGVSGAVARFGLPPGARRLVRVRYLSRGLDVWRYSFGAQAGPGAGLRAQGPHRFRQGRLPGREPLADREAGARRGLGSHLALRQPARRRRHRRGHAAEDQPRAARRGDLQVRAGVAGLLLLPHAAPLGAQAGPPAPGALRDAGGGLLLLSPAARLLGRPDAARRGLRRWPRWSRSGWSSRTCGWRWGRASRCSGRAAASSSTWCSSRWPSSSRATPGSPSPSSPSSPCSW